MERREQGHRGRGETQKHGTSWLANLLGGWLVSRLSGLVADWVSGWFWFWGVFFLWTQEIQDSLDCGGLPLISALL